MRKLKKISVLFVSVLLVLGLLAGCGRVNETSSEKTHTETSAYPKVSGLKYSGTVKLEDATQFSMYRYEGGYKLVKIKQEGSFLIVPKGKKVPEKLDDDITVIKQPLSQVYMAATAPMSLCVDIDGESAITMCSLRANEWSFNEPKERMKSGEMVFAGKYREPDYELLLKKKCDLAVESTMISHSPEVKEMLEKLGIPVLVDRSSYENTPLGRMEWVKLYGELLGKEDEAESFYNAQKKKTEKLKKGKKKSVAFFYVSTDGKAVVRRNDDYLPEMIKMAGGTYAYENLNQKSSSISVPISMEKFYDMTKDTDIILYNGSIDTTVRSLKDLMAKDPVMRKLNAVKSGNCWLAGSAMYQRPDQAGDMIVELNRVIMEKNPEGMTFITRLS